ncbi:glycoside hydrolase family 76 [Colletotrichum tofieldiae]|uniref:Mannan endo-1,6-alpha-mannosidase n=1 Tax=Colletotrichum tofieldiae TaxID=708197 RepID=A0A166SCW4_9PEZI|nr:glycoside hydrolase family 76 [Colletotrichum tofieldiae]GKT65408.1 glycoside hydrolase family 76 [Colletotrichum tofieldiae]GKT71405.1 glycoside hydrolase family 76 [Colletotrichum tofieldiae]
MVTTLATAASAALLLAGSLPAVSAQYYKIDSTDSIKSSAKTLAYDLIKQYKGNQTGEIPGILPGPPTEHKGDYYWWEGGAMMGTYIDYWKLTGDSTYNDLVMEGMLHQTGPNADYMPPNHTASLGNDDQGFWGMSAMLAAENKFPNPPENKPQWLALAQAVWTTQASPDRHDDTCNGGLRWQVPFSNAGYNYKNTIANGCFFNIGARLARYTNNATYAQHAEKTWDWLWGVNYIDHENWNVYDGGHVEHNCTDVNKQQFSYNAAILTQGAAFMYNYTNGSDVWRSRIEKLTESIFINFFPNNTGYELACEGRKGQCTADMLSFKGYVHRWLSVVTQIAPFMKDKILPVLKDSTQAAVNQCTGGETGRVCGFYWNDRVFVDPAVDKTSGAGEQMNVLAAVSSLLIESVEPPATNTTGGISKGDPDAGSKSKDNIEPEPITTADRAGAGILTAIVLAGGLGTWGWMSFGD